MITQQYIEKLKALGFEHVDVLDFEYKQTDHNFRNNSFNSGFHDGYFEAFKQLAH